MYLTPRNLIKFFILIIVASNLSYGKTLLILGDSLSSGYQMPLSKSWPILLNKQLKEVNIVNASISGDTAKNALDRLPRLLKKHNPDIILIEIGGNDGLRGANIKSIKSTIAKIIELSKVRAKTLLMQIEVPPQFGKRYRNLFSSIYKDLSNTYKIDLIPFLMLPIYLNNELMHHDKIHPNEDAQIIIASNMKEVLKKYLKEDSLKVKSKG